MWLLAWALVKVINMRTKLHEAEKERISRVNRRELEIKQAQLRTMYEVARGFQHRVNNPLAIISLAVTGTVRDAAGNPPILQKCGMIEDSAERIRQAVLDFSKAQKYEVEDVAKPIGPIANPPSVKPSLALDGYKRGALASHRENGCCHRPGSVIERVAPSLELTN